MYPHSSHNLAISLYLPGPTGPITWHATARQTLYVADGNQAADGTGAEYDARTTVPAWYVIDGVEVRATAANQAAIVTFGDSITDGTNSTQDANHRWPDYLARKLNARSGNQLSVIDEGIAGHRQLISQMHARGLRVFGATLTPFQGAAYYCEDGETKREAVNAWIRTSSEFDGVIDFDAATRDPANPLSYRPDFDSGDHLHPNDLGYSAMADTIDLNLFSP
ncbi:MAG: hypothetical protein JO020_15325 [Chloroflexi bacterium]|nr:hypothetical protein [Chloroflexota bacterium]MBV9895533.1 hypothetical protein [Chloroflexota bacterium]